MYADKLILQILDLEEPWRVGGIDVDAPSNRLDIKLDFGLEKKGFLGFGKKTIPYQYVTLRHLPMFGMRTFLQVPALDAMDTGKNWASKFADATEDFEQFTIKVLENCRSVQAAARITGLPVAEVRAISERSGAEAGTQEEVSSLQTAVSDATVIRQPVSEAQVYDDLQYEAESIVKETHPNWQKLLDGDIQSLSDSVALKMLLERVRRSIANDPGETMRFAGIRLLRQYFIRHKKVHEADINTFFSGASAASPAQKITPKRAAAAGAVNASGDHHPRWKELIDGGIGLRTDNVGLQMMLEQVRRSVERNPSEAAYQAGIKILERFFSKHRERLQDEMLQLGAEHERPAPAADNISRANVPAETDNIWHKVIDGAVGLRTGVIGLQMMLEQMRQSVVRNPSENSRLAAVRILRQFFVKHQAQLVDELRQLSEGGGAAVGVEASGAKPSRPSVPDESAAVWQHVINGDFQIDTDALALKMMLERIRISIQNNPSEGTRMAGIKILRQYFIKHREVHRTELGQLMAT